MSVLEPRVCKLPVPPLRDLGSLYFLIFHTFVTGTLFRAINLIELSVARKKVSHTSTEVIYWYFKICIIYYLQWYSNSTGSKEIGTAAPYRILNTAVHVVVLVRTKF